MDENTPKTNPNEKRSRSRIWKRLALPTLLTVAIGSVGSIGAKPQLLLNPNWKLVNAEPVQLDARPYRLTDNQDASAAKLGVSPYYFVTYNSPDGQLHWVNLANKKGSETADTRLPTIDPAKHSVRYLVVMKDHRRFLYDEGKSFVLSGTGSPDGKKGVAFRAISVPREGVKADFHPADVSRIELQVSTRR